jgi:hypothetical protein
MRGLAIDETSTTATKSSMRIKAGDEKHTSAAASPRCLRRLRISLRWADDIVESKAGASCGSLLTVNGEAALALIKGVTQVKNSLPVSERHFCKNNCGSELLGL